MERVRDPVRLDRGPLRDAQLVPELGHLLPEAAHRLRVLRVSQFGLLCLLVVNPALNKISFCPTL